MSKEEFAYVDPRDLRLGLFISLELGWMSHPFPAGSFKIVNEKQIETLRGLGLSRVRTVPAKSDPPLAPVPEATQTDRALLTPGGGGQSGAPLYATAVPTPADPRQTLLQVQRARQQECEQRFADTLRYYQLVEAQVHTQPMAVAQQCKAMVLSLVAQMGGDADVAVRLVKEGGRSRVAMHPVNVAVLSLLLGKAVGLSPKALADLTLAAFLHDIGKVDLPARLHWESDGMNAAERLRHQEHVMAGVSLAQEMGLSVDVIQTMSHHHEFVDGSGYPGRISAQAMQTGSRILALVNSYDTLCNPAPGVPSLTPHEALARMFSQYRARYDGALLSVFIRMMGVYPPGSVVQLADERYALVVSVNSSRPLKPRVMVYEPQVEPAQSLVLDLESLPGIGIRRSLKPSAMPQAALSYLAPAERLAYFFERSHDQAEAEAETA